jgi:hypothetical protein
MVQPLSSTARGPMVRRIGTPASPFCRLSLAFSALHNAFAVLGPQLRFGCATFNQSNSGSSAVVVLSQKSSVLIVDVVGAGQDIDRKIGIQLKIATISDLNVLVIIYISNKYNPHSQ